MKYIIGIDGGGTKTLCIIADNQGKKLYKCTGGPSNFLVTGAEKTSANLFSPIKECIGKLKIRYEDIAVVLLGTAGAGRIKDIRKFEEAFKSFLKEKNIKLKKFIIESDARIALEAAFGGKPGCILIAGTGSIIMGKDSNGNIYRAGGFGRYIGDEGSGYSLGRKALNAAAKEYDGRGNPTVITSLLKKKFKITSAEKLIDEIYNKQFDIPSAAPLLFEAAELNDPAAVRIIEDEVEELIAHIEVMAGKIKEPLLRLALIGGLLKADNIFSQKLKERIGKLASVKLSIPEDEPAMGAVLLGKYFIETRSGHK